MSNDEGNIVRVRKDARYFVASNVPFNDERLSWEARGVMGYLLSKPDDWQVRMTDLQRRGPAGMRIIKRVLAELRLAGYMSRERKRTPEGKFIWITTLYESPELNPKTIYTKPIDGSSIDGKCIDIVSTEPLNTKEHSAQNLKIKTAANKTVDAIIENEKQSAKSWQGREKMPPAIRDLADEFVTVTGIKPAKKELVWWLGEFSDWLNFGVLPGDVKSGVDYAKNKGFAVMSPASLTKTVRMLAANRKRPSSSGQVNYEY